MLRILCAAQVRPYKRAFDNLLAAVTNLLLLVFFMSATLFRFQARARPPEGLGVKSGFTMRHSCPSLDRKLCLLFAPSRA